jgi:hypothetical protein
MIKAVLAALVMANLLSKIAWAAGRQALKLSPGGGTLQPSVHSLDIEGDDASQDDVPVDLMSDLAPQRGVSAGILPPKRWEGNAHTPRS